MFTKEFKIKDLTCHACVSLSKSALSEIPGVLEAEVDLNSGQATIKATREVSWEEICQSMRQINKEAILLSN